MNLKIILIIACCIMLFIIMFLIFVLKWKFLEDKREKQNEEEKRKTAETIENAIQTKADARTGDHNADIKYMADKLHDYASK